MSQFLVSLIVLKNHQNKDKIKVITKRRSETTIATKRSKGIRENRRRLWQGKSKLHWWDKETRRRRSRVGEDTRRIVPTIDTRRSRVISTRISISVRGEYSCDKGRISDIDEAKGLFKKDKWSNINKENRQAEEYHE